MVRFPEEVLENARGRIPPEGILGEEVLMDALLKKLLSRCKRVPDLIADSVHARVSPFPEWREPHAVSQQTFSC